MSAAYQQAGALTMKQRQGGNKQGRQTGACVLGPAVAVVAATMREESEESCVCLIRPYAYFVINRKGGLVLSLPLHHFFLSPTVPKSRTATSSSCRPGGHDASWTSVHQWLIRHND